MTDTPTIPIDQSLPTGTIHIPTEPPVVPPAAPNAIPQVRNAIPIQSPTRTVPMFSPNGELGDVPFERVRDAINAGGDIAIPLTSPDGKHGFVPANRVHEALKAGGTADILGWDTSTLKDPSMRERVLNVSSGTPRDIQSLAKMSPLQAAQEINQAGTPHLENAMTPEEQRNHPMLHAGLEFAGSMASPENIAIMIGSGGLGLLPGPAGPLISRLLSAGFSIGMIHNALQEYPKFQEALAKGDESEAKYEITKMVLSSASAVPGVIHATTGEAMPFATDRNKAAGQAIVASGSDVANKVGDLLTDKVYTPIHDLFLARNDFLKSLGSSPAALTNSQGYTFTPKEVKDTFVVAQPYIGQALQAAQKASPGYFDLRTLDSNRFSNILDFTIQELGAMWNAGNHSPELMQGRLAVEQIKDLVDTHKDNFQSGIDRSAFGQQGKPGMVSSLSKQLIAPVAMSAFGIPHGGILGLLTDMAFGKPSEVIDAWSKSPNEHLRNAVRKIARNPQSGFIRVGEGGEGTPGAPSSGEGPKVPVGTIGEGTKPFTVEAQGGTTLGSMTVNVKQGDNIVSAIDFTSTGKGKAQIEMAYTQPGFEGMGLGKIAARRLIDEARKNGIVTLETGPVLSQAGRGLVDAISREVPFTQIDDTHGEWDLSKTTKEPVGAIKGEAREGKVFPGSPLPAGSVETIRNSQIHPTGSNVAEPTEPVMPANIQRQVGTRSVTIGQNAPGMAPIEKPLDSIETPRYDQVLKDELRDASPLTRRMLTEVIDNTGSKQGILDINPNEHGKQIGDIVQNIQRAYLADLERATEGAGRTTSKAIGELNEGGTLALTSPNEPAVQPKESLPLWWTEGRSPSEEAGRHIIASNEVEKNVSQVPGTIQKPLTHFYQRARDIAQVASPALRQRLFHILEDIDTYPGHIMDLKPTGNVAVDESVRSLQKAYLAALEKERPGLGRLMQEALKDVDTGKPNIGGVPKVFTPPLADTPHYDSLSEEANKAVDAKAPKGSKEGGFARFGRTDKAGNPKPLSDIVDVVPSTQGTDTTGGAADTRRWENFNDAAKSSKAPNKPQSYWGVNSDDPGPRLWHDMKITRSRNAENYDALRITPQNAPHSDAVEVIISDNKIVVKPHEASGNSGYSAPNTPAGAKDMVNYLENKVFPEVKASGKIQQDAYEADRQAEQDIYDEEKEAEEKERSQIQQMTPEQRQQLREFLDKLSPYKDIEEE